MKYNKQFLLFYTSKMQKQIDIVAKKINWFAAVISYFDGNVRNDRLAYGIIYDMIEGLDHPLIRFPRNRHNSE